MHVLLVMKKKWWVFEPLQSDEYTLSYPEFYYKLNPKRTEESDPGKDWAIREN
jgi:hypothetical protein